MKKDDEVFNILADVIFTFLSFFVTLHKIDERMATPIKAVPILSGSIAEDFVRQAEENERKPRRASSSEQRALVIEMERQLRECVPSWRRQ